MPMISTCRGCGRMFSSTALFDFHWVRDSGKHQCAEKDREKKHLIGYTHHIWRRMTEVELLAAGYQFEYQSITVMLEGVPTNMEREIWYDPATRENLCQVTEKEEKMFLPAVHANNQLSSQASLW